MRGSAEDDGIERDGVRAAARRGIHERLAQRAGAGGNGVSRIADNEDGCGNLRPEQAEQKAEREKMQRCFHESCE
jgi:hypothetical protein